MSFQQLSLGFTASIKPMAAAVLLVFLTGAVKSQTPPPSKTPEASNLPALVQLSKSSNSEISRLAQQLQSFFCNQPAALRLIVRLHQDLDYKPAADIGEEFLAKCDKDESIGFHTMRGWFRLTNFARALLIINRFRDEIWSDREFATWRGFILEKLNRNLEASADFERALYLFTDIRDVSGSQFYYVTRSLKAGGRYCEAIHPLELFLSFDPEKRRTTEIDTIISDLQKLGKCAPDIPAGNTPIKLRPDGGVFVVDADVNGRRGAFILDTGASTVHFTKEFAMKAGVKLDSDNMVMTQGVTGARKDYMSRVAKISLGSVAAHDVTVTVASDSSSLGKNVDGLLGQTFLSRFKVHVDATARTMSLGVRR